jgi:hypothetical protein
MPLPWLGVLAQRSFGGIFALIWRRRLTANKKFAPRRSGAKAI